MRMELLKIACPCLIDMVGMTESKTKLFVLI